MGAGPKDEVRFHRLLVAVDGSPSAALALSAAIAAARRDHAAVTLVSVAPDVLASARWPGAPAAPPVLQQDADAEAQRVLSEAVARVPADVGVTTVFRRGRAGPEIVALSRELGIDAILVGARGVGRVAALVGSVSNHVLHHADVAVFVAHAPRGSG